MNSIGNIMTASSILRDHLDHPVQNLRSIIDQMRHDLQWYQSKYPEAKTEKKQQLIIQLDAICRSLEECEPIDVWRTIWGKLGEARRDKYNGDVALCYFPLKPVIPEYSESKQIVVDLCGYNLNPYEYDYCRGKYFTSWVNDQEGGA